jgi:hypothetical protein
MATQRTRRIASLVNFAEPAVQRTTTTWPERLPRERFSPSAGVVQKQPFLGDKVERNPPAYRGGMLAWDGVKRARREGLAPSQARRG